MGAERQKRGPSLRRSLRPPAGDAYAGADLGNAGRLGTRIWLAGVALALALTPVFPPTAALGSIGWLVTAANAAVVVVGLRALKGRLTFNRLYAASYVGVIQIASFEWLAGAGNAPYDQLYLLAAASVGAVHPPRRVLVFFASVTIAALAPLAYGGWDSVLAANAILEVLLVAVATLLMAVLMSRVRAQRLVLQRDQAFATKLARIDALTGLGNRRGFDDALRTHRLGVRATGGSLLLVDISEFKDVNDRFGHVEGDRCLRQVASVVADTVRQGDLCYRWGGDEFVVLMPHTTPLEAEHIAGRLEQAVESLCLRPDGEPIKLVWGVAALQDGVSPSDVFRRADQGLFARKRSQPKGATRVASA